MLIKWVRGLANNSELLVKSRYLLDYQDRKNFVKFLVLLVIAGCVSLLGIGAVIPFAHLLTI